MERISIVLSLVKETKNKYRYEATQFGAELSHAPVDCIYLRKLDTGENPPKQIQVTVEAK